MMTDDEMMDIVRAKKRGDKIQYRRRCDEPWRKITRAEYPFDFQHLEYRIAPAPREYHAEILPSGGVFVHEILNSLTRGGESILLREVIPDDDI